MEVEEAGRATRTYFGLGSAGLATGATRAYSELGSSGGEIRSVEIPFWGYGDGPVAGAARTYSEAGPGDESRYTRWLS